MKLQTWAPVPQLVPVIQGPQNQAFAIVSVEFDCRGAARLIGDVILLLPHLEFVLRVDRLESGARGADSSKVSEMASLHHLQQPYRPA